SIPPSLPTLLRSRTPTATHASHPLSLHDALPISEQCAALGLQARRHGQASAAGRVLAAAAESAAVDRVGRRDRARRAALSVDVRSEEHTSELQSRENLVCRLLLEKKKT